MEHKQADGFFKQQINSLDTAPPDVSWQKERSWYVLEEKLNPVKKQPPIYSWLYAVAASVFLVIAISWVAFQYVNTQEKEIAHLKQKLDEVKTPEPKQEAHASTNTSDKVPLSDDKKQAGAKQELSVAQKKPMKDKNTQSENSPVKNTGTDSILPDAPLLEPEEEILQTNITTEEKQALRPKSAQEIMLGKVKQQHMYNSTKPIVIVFPGAQEEYIVREPASSSQGTERKIKLHQLIINSTRESTAEASPRTGADAYPRLNKEKSN